MQAGTQHAKEIHIYNGDDPGKREKDRKGTD
jgi:hypothetical protein